MAYNIIKKRIRTGSPEKEDKEMTALREEELNMVAGGNIFETACDGDFLYDLGYLDHQYCNADMIFNWAESSDSIDKAWKAAGITSVTHPFASNKYFKDGKEITESVAWQIVDPS